MLARNHRVLQDIMQHSKNVDSYHQFNTSALIGKEGLPSQRLVWPC